VTSHRFLDVGTNRSVAEGTEGEPLTAKCVFALNAGSERHKKRTHAQLMLLLCERGKALCSARAQRPISERCLAKKVAICMCVCVYLFEGAFNEPNRNVSAKKKLSTHVCRAKE
jgi:hypothetical protein